MSPGTIVGALTRRLNDIFYGWRVVGVSFLVNALASGTYFLGFTVFFLPISRDLHISRTATSLPFALSRIISGALGPVVGLWIDRLGPGKILAAGALVGGLGFILLRWTHSYALFLLVFLALLTVGIQSIFGSATSAAVSQWFSRRRGLALAVAQTGYSIGGGIIPPLMALGVRTVGWRTTAMIAGFGLWAVVLTLSTQLRRSPESMGLQLDGLSSPKPITPGTSAGVNPHSVSREVPLRQALRTNTYWLLALSFGFRSMVWGAVGIHLVAIMVWRGLEESTAGYLVGVYSIAWTPAVLVMGWIADRWSKPKIAGISSFIGTTGILLLLFWDQVSVWQMVLVLVLLAPNEAAWPLEGAMLADFFGRRNFATLRGVLMAVQSLMAAGTPVFSGLVYDATGGYFWAILPAAIVMWLSGIIIWLLPKPRLA